MSSAKYIQVRREGNRAARRREDKNMKHAPRNEGSSAVTTEMLEPMIPILEAAIIVGTVAVKIAMDNPNKTRCRPRKRQWKSIRKLIVNQTEDITEKNFMKKAARHVNLRRLYYLIEKTLARCKGGEAWNGLGEEAEGKEAEETDEAATDQINKNKETTRNDDGSTRDDNEPTRMTQTSTTQTHSIRKENGYVNPTLI